MKKKNKFLYKPRYDMFIGILKNFNSLKRNGQAFSYYSEMVFKETFKPNKKLSGRLTLLGKTHINILHNPKKIGKLLRKFIKQ
jgi:hypothetical protein